MDYIFMQPPFDVKPFKDMTKKDAQKHFDWYVGEITNRIELLKSAYEATLGGKKEELDFSEQSLMKIWNWFVLNVEITDKNDSEVEDEKRKYPEWAVKNLNKQKISSGWMSIAMDIAIYFSLCFINAFNSVKWGYVTKPKSLAYVNKPVLVGFKFNMELDATNIVRNLALEVAEGIKDPSALLEIYKVWVENVNKISS